jgi:hypothetical protein
MDIVSREARSSIMSRVRSVERRRADHGITLIADHISAVLIAHQE